MTNLWDMLTNHASEVYRTLSQGKVGQNLQADANKIKTGGRARLEQLVSMSPMESATSFGPMGAAGTIKLPSATSYSKVLANIAKAKIAKGEDLASVWKQTGYHPLGNTLVGEISDAETGFNLAEINKLKNIAETRMYDVSAPLGRLINHPELFKNYPWLKDEFVVMRSHADNEGSYNRKSKLINLSANDTDMYSTFLHELDHKLTIPEIFKPQAHRTYAQYLNLPSEQSARMRELRFKTNDYNSLPKLK